MPPTAFTKEASISCRQPHLRFCNAQACPTSYTSLYLVQSCMMRHAKGRQTPCANARKGMSQIPSPAKPTLSQLAKALATDPDGAVRNNMDAARTIFFMLFSSPDEQKKDSVGASGNASSSLFQS
ncbi:uncharacterized protein TrAtP1_008729 [Trichoderma atroviride]|uniref:uncharacterized protein n=1 Tax=Hypocrea atroviridis TaxID=63577 RepID=UPI00331DDA43|nr:hypothetical protein TrAtP1_008729 [Trichoderma atroviride]